MNLFELLAAVAGDLERNGVVYALTGSIASSLHGRPQLSYDADLALRMSRRQAEELAAAWGRQFYVSSEALCEAVEHSGMANVIDASSGWKVDLSVVPRTPFYDGVLSRRERMTLPGSSKTIWVCTPEDTILMKLLWRKDSRSQKQFNDALGVVESLGNRLDWEYLREWAVELGVTDDLNELKGAGLK